MTTKTSIRMTEEEFMAYSDDSAGVCINCEEITESGVEPDATGYKCEACDSMSVMGMEQALVEGHIEFVEDDNINMDDSD